MQQLSHGGHLKHLSNAPGDILQGFGDDIATVRGLTAQDEIAAPLANLPVMYILDCRCMPVVAVFIAIIIEQVDLLMGSSLPVSGVDESQNEASTSLCTSCTP